MKLDEGGWTAREIRETMDDPRGGPFVIKRAGGFPPRGSLVRLIPDRKTIGDEGLLRRLGLYANEHLKPSPPLIVVDWVEIEDPHQGYETLYLLFAGEGGERACNAGEDWKIEVLAAPERQ